MSLEDIANRNEQTVRLEDILIELERLDRTWNVHNVIAVICFFVSGGIAINVFFLMSDLSLWGEVSEYVGTSISIVSWIVVFFLFLFLLTKVGVKDLRSITKNYLQDLTLSLAELNQLHAALMSGEWKHGKILESVVSELAKQKSEN